jgi:hypothetical protein
LIIDFHLCFSLCVTLPPFTLTLKIAVTYRDEGEEEVITMRVDEQPEEKEKNEVLKEKIASRRRGTGFSSQGNQRSCIETKESVSSREFFFFDTSSVHSREKRLFHSPLDKILLVQDTCHSGSNSTVKHVLSIVQGLLSNRLNNFSERNSTS